MRNYKDYQSFVAGPPQKVGHIWSQNLDVNEIKRQLSSIRGHLVPMALDFLDGENLIPQSTSVNAYTMQIYSQSLG